MDNYLNGFMSKCAEYGVSEETAVSLYKLAQQYNRTEFDNAIQDQMNSIADKEGLDIDSTNKPGTMLGRGFRRMFMSKDSYGRYQANLASKEIAKARQRKMDATKAADRKAQDRMRSQQIVNGIGMSGAPRPAQPFRPPQSAQPPRPSRPAQSTQPHPRQIRQYQPTQQTVRQAYPREGVFGYSKINTDF